MIYQVSEIKEGIHVYLLNVEEEINNQPGEMEVDVPDELTTNSHYLMEYVKQVVEGR